MIFDRLYYHSPITNELTSRLVTDWGLEDEGRSVRLTLRPDALWQDGMPVTADDVCFTVAALLDPGTTSPIADGYRSQFESCTVLDDSQLVIRFTKIYHSPLRLSHTPTDESTAASANSKDQTLEFPISADR